MSFEVNLSPGGKNDILWKTILRYLGNRLRDVECVESTGIQGVLYKGGGLAAVLEQELGDGRK